MLCGDPPCTDPVDKDCISGMNPPAKEGDIRDVGLIPGSGRSPAAGHGNPLQYSFLGNHLDRGAWQTTYSPWGRIESDMVKETQQHNTHTHRKLTAILCNTWRGGVGWGVGREVQEGGDICMLMMDSRCCMTEANTNCKAIVLRLNTN